MDIAKLFGSKESVCQRLVATLAAGGFPLDLTLGPVEAMKCIQRSKVLDFLYLQDRSLAELLPINLDEEARLSLLSEFESFAVGTNGVVENGREIASELRARLKMLDTVCAVPLRHSNEISQAIAPLKKKYASCVRTE